MFVVERVSGMQQTNKNKIQIKSYLSKNLKTKKVEKVYLFFLQLKQWRNEELMTNIHSSAHTHEMKWWNGYVYELETIISLLKEMQQKKTLLSNFSFSINFDQIKHSLTNTQPHAWKIKKILWIELNWKIKEKYGTKIISRHIWKE